MKKILALVTALLLALPLAAEAGEMRKLALQVSDNDPVKMNAALNVAANVSRYYTDKGDQVEIVIVAFNAGLHMLRDDTSPVKERLAGFAKSMPDVSFAACGNTRDGMAKAENKEIPIVAQAKVVPAGVVTLMELSQKGYTIIRP